VDCEILDNSGKKGIPALVAGRGGSSATIRLGASDALRSMMNCLTRRSVLPNGSSA
jgi:hypothetical protein